MSDDLVAWLRAQLDDDERAADAIENASYMHGVESDAEAEILRFADTDRIRRDIAAKRRIMDWVVAQQVPNSTIGDDFLYPLVALAAIYSDRPGYREEWRP